MDKENGQRDGQNIRVTLGCEVDVFDNAEAAMDALDERNYGVVIVEPMRRISPLVSSAAYGFIMRAKRDKGIPVIMSSVAGPEELFQLGLLREGVDYDGAFTKPYWPGEELCPVLKEMFGEGSE
ncbi:hypothetical protein CMI37_29925 [Candidatus Pacearchaeota archaeon]|nr:hypothetical protein [Candidatus Pacearchaeota archaeon]